MVSRIFYTGRTAPLIYVAGSQTGDISTEEGKRDIMDTDLSDPDSAVSAMKKPG